MQDLFHFSGIGGAGMNPLARLLAARGHRVQGSDRAFDRQENPVVAQLLRQAGIVLLPQDGSAITPAVTRVVHSAAVEAETPELAAARRLGIPTVPRPALLAELVAAARPGVAIAGSSGKSTVTGMLAWILRRVGRPATVLGGAALAESGANHMGCFAAAGPDAPLLAEACESDGTLAGYRPAIGLIHNLTRDHDELDGLRRQFAAFAAQCRRLYVNNDCSEANALAAGHPDALRYGRGACPLELLLDAAGPERARGVLVAEDGEFALDLPQPGVHNLDNACAAVALAGALGVATAAACESLHDFPGVARRFQRVGTTASGIRVIDDYAHNGAKISAAVHAAQLGGGRVLAVFQPHGYGPARFLRPELRELLPRLLRPGDRFCYAGIYYAGGTVAQDISSKDLAGDLPPELACGHAENHAAVLDWLAAEAQPGDTVLLMGARDPRLGDLAQAAVGLL